MVYSTSHVRCFIAAASDVLPSSDGRPSLVAASCHRSCCGGHTRMLTFRICTARSIHASVSVLPWLRTRGLLRPTSGRSSSRCRCRWFNRRPKVSRWTLGWNGCTRLLDLFFFFFFVVVVVFFFVFFQVSLGASILLHFRLCDFGQGFGCLVSTFGACALLLVSARRTLENVLREFAGRRLVMLLVVLQHRSRR